ncbi:MAG: molybdopterin-dependent oxidoreductase [Armatimonadetes bacterium]|nr:molybdopterin-dependent oxidoreductase [Armatimonadota bacterium]
MSGSATGRYVGKAIRRVEDRRYLLGKATYVDDLRLPGMAHAAVLRSPHGLAALTRIDGRAARAHPGVIAVHTGQEVADRLRPLAVGNPGAQQLIQIRHPILASGTVRYVGEPVAVVVAGDRYAARDGVALIEVEYEPLPAVTDPEAAIADGALLLHEAAPRNIAMRWTGGSGDVDEAFRRADRVVRGRFRVPRLAPVPMEGRGSAAAYDPGTEQLTLWVSTQAPHRARSGIAAILGFPEHRIRAIAPDVGGGFGSKGGVYPEEVLVCYLAMHLGRPVKWTEDRRENLTASYQGRGQIADVEAAVRGDGTVLGIRARILGDLGAYCFANTPMVPTVTARMITGVYRIPAAAVEILGVLTNKVPTGPYRGAGRPEGAYYSERTMELIARELNLDPIEVRRRNFIPPNAFPFKTTMGMTYDSGRYAAALDRALERVDYAKLRREQVAARVQGKLVGIGVAMFVERAGGVIVWESGGVRVSPSGKVTVTSGSSSHGQGHATVFAQIAAEVLGVPMEDVVVVQGDTAMIPQGIGTFGSRSAAAGGSAVYLAARKVSEKARAIAAHMLEASPQDLAVEDARFFVKGTPQRSVTFREVAGAAYGGAGLPPGMELGLDETVFFNPPGNVFPYGCHIALVEVDPDTGHVHLKQYTAEDDSGSILNPLIVRGQVHGGLAQGVAQALFEEAAYGEDGQPLAGTLMDYAVPKAAQLINFVTDHIETPSPFNPLGVKGVGEAGTIAAPTAISNAVADALAPLGIGHLDMPFTPERVWRAIQAARAGAGRTG